MSKTKKGNPIPAKFDSPEETLIIQLAGETGLSQSEIIRRGMRLLRLEIARRGKNWLQFLTELRRGNEPDIRLRVAEDPPAFGVINETLSPRQLALKRQPKPPAKKSLPPSPAPKKRPRAK